MFWKKKKEIMTLDDIADALNECDRIVQEFQEKPIDPAYGHIMDIHLERIMKTEADSEDTHPKINNLFFVTRDDGAFGKLDLLNEAALFWSEDREKSGFSLLTLRTFGDLKRERLPSRKSLMNLKDIVLKKLRSPLF